MRKLIILLSIVLFSINVNAQSTADNTIQETMSSDSLITNYVKIIAGNGVQLSSFEISVNIDGYEESVNNNDGKLSKKQIDLIKKVEIGKKVYFGKIKGKDKDGKDTKINGISIVIK